MRLSKFIAHSGFCSRREEEQLISSRKVKINKEICEDFSYKVRAEDEVFIGRKKIQVQEKIEVYALNKPRGYITSKVGQNNRKNTHRVIMVREMITVDCFAYHSGQISIKND